MNNPWKKVKENIIYQNRFGYTLREDDVITPAGKPGKYMVLETNGFVDVVALTNDQKVVMIRQWRYPVDREFLELPAGGISVGEDPLETAKRELREETGFVGGEWSKMSEFWEGNGAMKIKGHLFLAKNVVQKESEQEDTENIVTELIDFAKVQDMVLKGEIDEYRTIMGILFAKNLLVLN